MTIGKEINGYQSGHTNQKQVMINEQSESKSVPWQWVIKRYHEIGLVRNIQMQNMSHASQRSEQKSNNIH